jgi:small subunit ribosomal protein S1
VPENYIPGQIVEGTVTKITNFGVFVELEQDLEGLLHVSELADHKVEDPHEVVKIGDKIQVKILRVDSQERKIGLSKKRAEWSAEHDAHEHAEPARPRRGGLQSPGDEPTDLITGVPFVTPSPAATEPSETPGETPAGGDETPAKDPD